MLYKTYYQSTIASITLASDGDNIIGLWLEGQKYYEDIDAEDVVEKDDLLIFVKTKKWLDSYFAGEKPSISDLSLAPRGGEFRKIVWEFLSEIPYGELTTYKEIAKKVSYKMGKVRMSGQAVGGAVGHNPISIIIQCHRVVGSNGSLTGYAGGITKKIALLELEGANMSKLFIPKKGTAL